MLTPRSLPYAIELDAASTLRRWRQFEAWITAPERVDDCQVFFVQQDEPDFWQHLGRAVCGNGPRANVWMANRFCDLDSDDDFVRSIISDCDYHDEETSFVFAFDDATDALLFKTTWLGA